MVNNEVAKLMNNYGISFGNIFKIIDEVDTSIIHYSLAPAKQPFVGKKGGVVESGFVLLAVGQTRII